MKASRPHWITDRLLNVIVQMGFERLPDLPDVPRALEFVPLDVLREYAVDVPADASSIDT